jgi:hypothetical protein
LTPAELTELRRHLPTGADNGTTVNKLAWSLDWPERKVREGMALLRREHVPVAALPITNGVFVVKDAADLDKLRRYRDGLHSRAISQLVTCHDLDQMIDEIAYSPTLFGT